MGKVRWSYHGKSSTGSDEDLALSNGQCYDASLYWLLCLVRISAKWIWPFNPGYRHCRPCEWTCTVKTWHSFDWRCSDRKKLPPCDRSAQNKHSFVTIWLFKDAYYWFIWWSCIVHCLSCNGNIFCELENINLYFLTLWEIVANCMEIYSHKNVTRPRNCSPTFCSPSVRYRVKPDICFWSRSQQQNNNITVSCSLSGGYYLFLSSWCPARMLSCWIEWDIRWRNMSIVGYMLNFAGPCVSKS